MRASGILRSRHGAIPRLREGAVPSRARNLLLALALNCSVAGLASSQAAARIGPGVSHELAKHRAAQIADVRYGLEFDVTRRDTAIGHARISFTKRLTGNVVVDFRGISFSNVVANGTPIAVASRDGHLTIAASWLRSGNNVIEIDFKSAIAPAGASVIRFHDPTDNANYVYTLLVPADANQLFPCFDQPDLKARVSLKLTTPREWGAVANGKLVRADTANGITYNFAESEPISTYLVAFAAGPWSIKSSTVGGRPISMYVRASRAREVETDTLIALNARAIRWLSTYTAQPYPFQKFDFVLAPAFPFGGMEHPGAVFYNEESFIYRERPTLTQTLGREATIFHEVAHQWFGDFTTMRWFDDLWLKEGFATYLAAVMQSDLSPTANAWKTFYLRNKPAAYGVDASAGTTPVWQQLANLDQAKSNYGAIVYNKAPGILKQLNYLVGDTAFRDGLRAYLRDHAYGNATWGDLLGAVGTAGHRSLEGWGRSYITRPGMPVHTQELTVKGGRIASLVIEQQAARTLSGSKPWPARVEVILGYAGAPPVRVPVEIRGPRTVVPVSGRTAPDFVFVNSGDYGYSLVRFDQRSRAWIEAHIGEVSDDFLRAMLWGALWDEVRDARLSPMRFAQTVLRELPRETDEQIVPSLLGRLSRTVSAYLTPRGRDSITSEAERVVRAISDDTSRSYGVRKNNLDTYINLARSPSALRQLAALLDSTTAAGAPLRPPTRWAIVTTLIARGAPNAESLLLEETRRDSTTEGKRRAFAANAARPDSATKAQYWSRYFADRDLNEDWVTASLRGFHDPAQDTFSRPYLIPALDSLQWIQRNRRIFFLGNWIGATLDGQRSPEALSAVDMFLGRPGLPKDLREKILQSRDELERTVVIRRTFP